MLTTTGVTDEPTPGGSSGGTFGGSDIISTVIGAGAAIYNTSQQKKMAEQQNKANRELAEYQYSKDLESWNRQNDYNSPVNQMARYKAAGLNPNQIYGSGSSSSGNATQLPKYNAPTLQQVPTTIAGIPEVLSMYQDFKLRAAQIESVNATTENTRARTTSEKMRPFLLDIQGKLGQQTYDFKDYTNPYQAAILGGEARSSEAKTQQEWQKLRNMTEQEQIMLLSQKYTNARISGQQVQNEKLQAEKLFQDYKNDWMRAGVTTGDSPYLRILVRMFNEVGIDWAGGFQDYMNSQRKR